MLNSLRSRLLASYAVVLLLTLVVIVIALLFLLQTRPVPTEWITDRLGTALQTVLTWSEGQGAVIPNIGPTKLEQRILNGYANRFNIRILVTDRDGVVSYDSKGGFKAGEKVVFVGQPYTNGDVPQEPLMRGSFRGTRNDDWLYVGQAPTDSSGTQLLTFATTAPKITPAEMIRYYGSGVLVPVFQAGLIGFGMAFLFALWIARSVARPLQEVADTARAIAEGHADRKAPVRGPSEVRTLAIAFNQMTQQAAESQQAQRDFLANVSHDLRTPLTSIRGFSQAIIDGVASNPQQAQRAASVIHDEAARMYRMVEELLDLARIEAGRLAMTRHGVRLGEVIGAVGERLSLVARENELTVNIEVAPLIPVIAGDGDRLAQVFTNLVDNAIKHTPPGGTVTLRAQMQDNGVLVTVRDTGEGIPAADLPHIFDRFYQVDKSRQRREGAGLGLTISHQIITAHNGRIWVESKENEWTQFNVWLPLPAADSSTIMRRRTDVLKGARA